MTPPSAVNLRIVSTAGVEALGGDSGLGKSGLGDLNDHQES